MLKDGGSPFSQRLYSMLKHGQNSDSFKFIICPDVNFRVWNASEFNKSKTLFEEYSRFSLFEECSRFSLLHIQKICVKRYMKCLYFLNFWVHFTYVHYDQPKMVDLPNIPHAINSWQFLQGKKTTYWMYFGLYIRWKFRKHYGKHSGHGSVHLWHHSGTSLFLVLLCSSKTRKPVNKLFLYHSWELEFSVENLVASFPPKIVWGSCQMQWLPSPSLGCIPVSYTHLTLPTIYSV